MSGKTLTCAAAAAALLLSPALATAALADDGDNPTAQQLADQAREGLRTAKSVHLNLTDKSAAASASKRVPTSIDLSLDQDANCAGSMRMGADGGSVKLIKRGADVWMKPDTEFWKAQIPGNQGSAVADLFNNRYIHGSTSDTLLIGMAGVCDLTAFQREALSDSDHVPPLKKGAETTLDGTKVIPLTYPREDGRTIMMYVTADSNHHLFRATEKGEGADTALTFTDYNKPVPSATPSADESVDISELQSELQKF
ncbi:hypothetical protein [Streptomyces sp. NPDC001530]|uniref:hypothetical protein n=1 Tax=Streptomyces sp. NPDC001530 TaxID=3364582 RepID=UPI003696E765